MPVIQCLDCGKGRRYLKRRGKGGSIPKRCKPCAAARHALRVKALREERRRKKLCQVCGEGLSSHSIAHCDACGGYHTGYQARAMREKRGVNPAYREDERNKVRARMRAIRAEHRKSGVNAAGVPLLRQFPRTRSAASPKLRVRPI